MALTIILTGAGGFLGRALCGHIGRTRPDATLVPLVSPRNGGVDLADAGSPAWLRSNVRLSDPSSTVLIHAAADLEWNTRESLLRNTAMACTTAQWARDCGLGFSVLVSSVSVYPAVSNPDRQTPCNPGSLYGLGKWTAERVWALELDPGRHGVVRLAGLWGWQARPTLFWNRVLLAAARGSPAEPRPIVRRRGSRRNYLPVTDAAACVLKAGTDRLAGLSLAAGRDTVDTAGYVAAVSGLPGSRLNVQDQDDGRTDEMRYAGDAAFDGLLTPFPEALDQLWRQKPAWLG